MQIPKWNAKWTIMEHPAARSVLVSTFSMVKTILGFHWYYSTNWSWKKEMWLVRSNVVNDLIVFIYTRRGGEKIEGKGEGRRVVGWDGWWGVSRLFVVLLHSVMKCRSRTILAGVCYVCVWYVCEKRKRGRDKGRGERREGGWEERRQARREGGKEGEGIVEHGSSSLGLDFRDKKCSMYKKQCSGWGVI